MTFVEPYSVAAFNSTPALDVALQKHENVGGNDWVHTVLGPIFQKHRLEKILGINLLHHHFRLENGEYLTEVSGTSTPWKSQTGAQASLWAFDADSLHLQPLEFSMDNDDSRVPYPEWLSDKMASFLKDLSDALTLYNVNGIYGLTRYPGDDFKGRVEMTVGRANVNLTPAQASRVAKGFFFFSKRPPNVNIGLG